MNPLDFQEFPATSLEDWKKLVSKELGEKPLESLQWNTGLGFSSDAYYTGPVKATNIGNRKPWEIAQYLHDSDNQIALDCLSGGAQSLVWAREPQSLDSALKGIFLTYISSHFSGMKNAVDFNHTWLAYLQANGYDSKQINGSLAFDAFLQGADEASIIALATSFKHNYSLFRVLAANADAWHNKGASPVVELAYALAAGNEYLHVLTQNGFTVDEASAMIQFNFATGSSYFIEIAKYRAFRQLWSLVIEQYQPVHQCTKNAFVHASTSLYLQSAYDGYNNLLRATTQAASAIIGGADSVCVMPFDAAFAEAGSSSARWARNIQHLLREESYFDQLQDAGSGSYYIENLTSELGQQAWSLFQEIEEMGGVKKGIEKLSTLTEDYDRLQKQAIAEGKKVWVGVNKYPNKQESSYTGSNHRLVSDFESNRSKQEA